MVDFMEHCAMFLYVNDTIWFIFNDGIFNTVNRHNKSTAM